MTVAEKCPHPACDCVVEKGGRFGKYCSEHCKDAASMSDLRCHCHHPACEPKPRQPEPADRTDV